MMNKYILYILAFLPASAMAGSYTDLATWSALTTSVSTEDFESYAETDSPSGSYTGFTAASREGGGLEYIDFAGDMSLCDPDGGVAPEIAFTLNVSSSLFGLVPQSLDFSHEVCGYYGGSLVECIAISSDASFTGYEFASLVDVVVFDATMIDSICVGTVYTEADNDGDGYTSTAGDCDDSEALAYPGGTEMVCDGIDNDCSDATLDDPDTDSDGFGSCEDCNDEDGSIHPDATEVLDDGIDQDCDGSDATTPDDTASDDTGSDTGEVEGITVPDGDLKGGGGCSCQVTRFNWDHSLASLLLVVGLVVMVARGRRDG